MVRGTQLTGKLGIPFSNMVPSRKLASLLPGKRPRGKSVSEKGLAGRGELPFMKWKKLLGLSGNKEEKQNRIYFLFF